MTYCMKYIPRWLILTVCTLLLALLISACSFGGSSTTSSPTPTPPTVVSTTAPGMTTYTGDGYTINYPSTWTVKKDDNGVVTFNDPSGIAYLGVGVVPNPNGVVPASNLVNVGLEVFKSKSQNYHTVDIAPTTTVGGDTWSQGSATGDIVPTGQTAAVNAKTVVIADNHLANSPSTKGYTIAYVTGTQVFDLAFTSSFQPMLQSFKFAA